MKPQRTNKLYNFLVNTYGLSKEAVMELVDKRIESLLAKHIDAKLNSNEVERIISNRVATILNDGTGGYYEKDATIRLVKNMIDNKIEKLMEKQYKIELRAIRKDVKVIHRARK